MRKWNKLLALLLAMVMVLGLNVTALAEEATTASGDIVVLYTNDVHTYIDNGDEEEAGLRYSNVAALKDELAAAGNNVLLVDAGDAIQGTAYGSMDKGATIVKLMNAAGYDLATLGNHEFDYGMSGAMNAIEWAEYPYVSCNFYNEKDGVVGETVLDSYKVFETNGMKIAFIGITTPESFTKSTPAYFQDENGNYIYGIAGGTDGAALYAAVQTAIDAASAEADLVIALGHLGDDPASQPWTSEEVIANTTGLDAFIDGHSHSTVSGKEVADKAGNTVLLTQTGEYLGAIGKMTISADGTIATELITKYAGVDADVKAIEDAWITEIDTQLGKVIGSIDATLDNYDADGKRLVRSQETNTGDFAADALYYLFDNMGLDVDFAIMNGGGVRNKAITGEISYKTCKEIHTFGNVACLQTITGQQILDALEWGARDAGSAECGGFLHVSGLKYTIDTTIPSTVQKDEKGVWTGAPTGEYRVQDVQVLNKETGAYEALDLAAKYNLAGYNYTLRDLGDGYAMFDGAVNVLDYVMEDYMVLANYVQSFEGGKVTGYENLTGEGRITVKVAETHWYDEYVAYVTEKALMDSTDGDFRASEETTRAELAEALYRLAGSPAVTSENPFTDVADDASYKNAVIWAYENGVVKGTTETTFAPDASIKRQEIAALLFRYVEARGYDVSVGENTNILSFTDAETISEYAIPAMQWACGTGLLQGNADGTLAPRATATRAQVAAIVMRYAEMEFTAVETPAEAA